MYHSPIIHPIKIAKSGAIPEVSANDEIQCLVYATNYQDLIVLMLS